MSSMEKHLDSPEHMAKRIKWVIKRYGKLTNMYAPVCYIDEKWFYKVNQRRKIKVFPKAVSDADKTKYKKLKTLSGRFSIKTMFMAVVAGPLPHRNFDGRIHMERASKTVFVSKRTSHHNFSTDALINSD